MNSILELTTHNSLMVLAGTALLGVSCGVIGSFTVLRERALIGDCIAHASLPGICASFLIFHERDFFVLMVGAIISGLLSAAAVTSIRRQTRIKEDTALALVLSCFFGCGITLSRLIQNTPTGAAAGLDSFIFGKAATISLDDVVTIGIVALITVTTVTLLFKEFTLLCFDGEFAQSQNLSVALLDFLLMLLVCGCTAAGLPAVGAVLMAALLIFPAVTARLWSNRIGSMVPLAAAFGALSCLLGTSASAALSGPWIPHGLPTGPLIALSAAVLFFVSLIYSLLCGMGRRR